MVLHFRRPSDVVLLAVHRRELKRVGAILTLPLQRESAARWTIPA
ncbi:hypothetical protein ACIRG5_13080 [Lentzea sp. NPDC102401]